MNDPKNSISCITHNPDKYLKKDKPLAERPEEWDFRLVKEEQLAHALEYEYARSTVAAGGTRPTLTFPADICAAIDEGRARPWTVLSDSERKCLCASFYWRRPVIDISPWKPPGPNGLDFSKPSSVEFRYFIMRVDWEGASDHEVEKAFHDWLKEARPQGTKSKKGVGGKGSVPPWDWLRQLAAWRLQSAQYNHGRAKELVRDLQKIATGINPNDVLPDYSESGTRVNAVRNAHERITRGVSLVQICQRWPQGERFLAPNFENRKVSIINRTVTPS